LSDVIEASENVGKNLQKLTLEISMHGNGTKNFHNPVPSIYAD